MSTTQGLAIRERDFQVYDTLKKLTVDIIERHSGGSRLVATGVTQEDADYIVAMARMGPKLAAFAQRLVDVNLNETGWDGRNITPMGLRTLFAMLQGEAKTLLAEAREASS